MDVLTLTNFLGGKMMGSDGRAPCPICQNPKHSNPSLTISQGDTGKTIVHCHKGCNYRDILDFVGHEPKQIATIPQKAELRKDEFAKSLYAQAKNGDLELACYLKSRGIPQIPEVGVRFAQHCKNPDGTSGPALIFPLRDTSDAIRAVHRIYLEPDEQSIWRKKQRGTAKAMLGATSGTHFTVQSGCSRLLFVTEGLENAFALTFMLKEAPALFSDLFTKNLQLPPKPVLDNATIWATASASNLGNLELPDAGEHAFTEVIIFGDSDEAGGNAIKKLAKRASQYGYSAHGIGSGKDLNEVVNNHTTIEWSK